MAITASSVNAEVAHSVVANGITTNYHDEGSGDPLLLLHGSGPGVSAWANWRMNLPELSRAFRVVAPDIVGFGYTERPDGIRYDVDTWVAHFVGLLDALDLPKVSVVGNSFGGGLALAAAIRHPERFDRLVLMGSSGVSFPITDALDEVWGYEPSVAAMRRLLDLFAYDRGLVSDELAELRHRASVRPGVQEAFAAMFPAPRQRWVDALASDEDALRALEHEVLLIHGREDRILPLSSTLRLFDLIPRSELHVFGRCGHWTQIEHAATFNRLVADFVGRGGAT
jgi:2-hydroxymuconate-semialdehyde hydrolase